MKTILENTSYSDRDVSYDGETSTLTFSNTALEENIAYLALALNSSAIKFGEVFAQLEPSRQEYWSKDDNGLGGDSRIEPFDLLVVTGKNDYQKLLEEITEQSSSIDPVTLGAAYSAGIRSAMGLTASAHQRMLVIRDSEDPLIDNFFLLCGQVERMKPDNLSDQQTNNSLQILLKLQQGTGVVQAHNIPVVNKPDSKAISINCGGKTYRLGFKFVGNGTPVPKPSLSKKSELNVIMTTSLISEMSDNALVGTAAYLQAYGYQIELNFDNYYPTLTSPVTNLKDEVLNQLNKADVFIPVAHGGGRVDHVFLGSPQSVRMNAKKFFHLPDGSTKQVNLQLYFPPSNTSSWSNSAELKDRDLVNLFTGRRTNHSGPLLVLNMSCFSESSIKFWMRGYKQFHSIAMSAHPSDAPIVFGAKSGFATASTFQILSHFDYPLSVIEKMAVGGTIEDMTSVLSSPIEDSYTRAGLGWAERINNLFGQPSEQFYQSIWDSTWKSLIPAFSNNYDPVVNLNIPYNWDGSERMDIELTNVNNQDDVIIYKGMRR